ncbi:hypothetical protein ACJDU8_15575 [Clostridium sp. WILCCON 0269]|uniref:Uncharacterized protein n=1 Tax=Candidatus Clostridium eludens TaxID=3381663 RepID=A0ABW8SMS4_9CLOT
MYYSFNSDIAQKYGVEGAVIIENLYFWILKNKANEKHFYDGCYWTYNSIKAFTVLFPFWTRRQIERILNRLEKDGAIKTGNYNRLPYDRTKWYALSQTVISIYANGEMDITDYVNDISPNGEMTFPHLGKPIPDNKPDNKPDNDNVNLPWIEILAVWNDLPEPIKKINAITKLRKEKIQARVNNLSLTSKDILQTINNIKYSEFLQGKNNKDWVIDFDWLFKDDTRFTRVLENKYQTKTGKVEFSLNALENLDLGDE